MTALNIVLLIVSTLVGLGAIIAGFGYTFAKFSEGKGRAKTEEYNVQDRTEKIYRDLTDAQEKRITATQAEARTATEKIAKLEGVIQEQNKQRKWFEDILVAALDVYFQTNPELAGVVNKAVTKARQRSVKASAK